METIDRVVWQNVGTGQLLITIPKGSSIKRGDLVRITKLWSKEDGRERREPEPGPKPGRPVVRDEPVETDNGSWDPNTAEYR